MAKQVTPTPEQTAAITRHGKALLVSAAAGSGKTLVLTERIIHSLLDPKINGTLSRMLIVTYTRAAAGELKEKIAKALSKEMAKNPGNTRLSEQLLLLGSAQISTIDAFFQKAVRANFEQLSLPASFRLADEGELIPLRMEILNRLLEEFYQKYDEPSSDASPLKALRNNRFAYAMDHLMSDRNDGNFEKFLLKFPTVYAAELDGVHALKRSADSLRENATEDFLSTPHGTAIAKHLSEQYASLISYLEDLQNYAAPMPDLYKKIRGTLDSDLNYCYAVRQALDEGDYERLHVVIPTFIAGNFPSLAELKTDRMEDYQNFRNKTLKETVKAASALVAPPEAQIRNIMLANADLIDVLYDFFKEFEERLFEEKKERGVLEFNDVRAQLYSLLEDANGNPTPFAQSLAAQYDAIYIDEYQDVDFVQDRIFDIIGGNRRFMVGDIKQSIYAFRGSEPSIFSAYRKSMPLYTDPAAENANACCIFMSNNFRCDEPVIHFTNRVCAFLFSACEECVGYTKNDDLRLSKVYDDPIVEGLPAPVQVAVFDSTAAQNKACPGGNHAPDEPVWVAAEISRLLREGTRDNGKKIECSDIKILVRKNKHGTAFARELKKLNIPVTTAKSANILQTPLLSELLNLLRAIDNPYRDLPLSEFLLSGLGGFTLEELSQIRDTTDESASLYEAMQTASQNASGLPEELREKTRHAVDYIDGQRINASALPADRFLRLLYQSEWLHPYADMPAALFLYDQARSAQRNAYCGLYEFLSNFKKQLESDKLSLKGFTKEEDAVTIMTIHNSKGLEFPVVFCVSAASDSKKSEAPSPVLFHRTLGCAAKYYNALTGELEKTPLHTAAELTLNAEDAEESIRTLYVALTRASERLYVTGTLGGLWSTAKDQAAHIKRGDRASILRSPNYLTWIMAALKEPAAKDEPTPWSLTHYEAGTVTEGVPLEAQKDDAVSALPDAHTQHCADVITRHRAFASTADALQGIPTKVAASKLRPDLLDRLLSQKENDERALLAQIELMQKAPSAFDALLKDASRPDAAEIGTATHAFLEFCDFSALRTRGIAGECERLVNEGFLSPESVAILNRAQLDRFLESDLFAWIEKAVNVRREQKFAFFLPLGKLTQKKKLADAVGDREIFVQGSIDLLLTMPDGTIRLIDYKTDHLTREEHTDMDALREHMLKSHKDQLVAYARAVQNLFSKPPDDIRIYSLPLGKTVALPLDEILAEL